MEGIPSPCTNEVFVQLHLVLLAFYAPMGQELTATARYYRNPSDLGGMLVPLVALIDGDEVNRGLSLTSFHSVHAFQGPSILLAATLFLVMAIHINVVTHRF